MVQVKNGADRLPAARAVPSAVRRDAEDAAGARVPGHQGVPRLRHAPRLPGHDVRGGARDRHACARAGLDGGEGDRRQPATASRSPAWPASPTSAATATGAARTSTRPTGTSSAASPGTRTPRRATSPRTGRADLLHRAARRRRPIVEMMMRSREAVVDYMTPLGLHHLMDTGHHYGPGPWVVGARAPRLEPDLLPPRRQGRASASTAPRPAATRSRSTRPQLARHYADPTHDARQPAALVPSRAVGLPDASGTHAVGRAGRALRPGVAAAVGAAQALGRGSKGDVDARRHARWRRSSRPGARGAVVARRLHRLLPLGERHCRCPRARPPPAAHARPIQVPPSSRTRPAAADLARAHRSTFARDC